MDVWGPDPRPWLLESEEAPAIWLTSVPPLDEARGSTEELRRASVAGPMVQGLIGSLPVWGETLFSGHQSPGFLPNMLHLLADLGVRAGDDERVDRALDHLESHQGSDGRFQSFGAARGHPEPVWGSLPCDHHIITEVLIRFGRAESPTTRLAIERIVSDFAATSQGPGWACVPDPRVGFRGPGRKGDVCPQVTLQALRLFSRLPEPERPPGVREAVRTMLRVWENRRHETPYMFGHGKRFKVVKWPPLWYCVYWVADALGRYPEVWAGRSAEDRRLMAELVAGLIAYNVGADGRVVPGSTYRGFADHSFGQKRVASPVATALLATVAWRFAAIECEIAAVDVMALASSRGGTGTPVAPAV